FRFTPTTVSYTLSLHDALPISFLDSLLDVNMRIGVGGNLREMRDAQHLERRPQRAQLAADHVRHAPANPGIDLVENQARRRGERDRKSTRLNSSHLGISYAVFC